jgi:predicted GNAT family acetyltransferase
VSPQVTVVDEPGANRYVIDADAERVGLLSYRIDGDQIALVHTEIQSAVARRGLGSELVAFALNDARSRGLSVLPRCPFVRAYIKQHPEYRDLVPQASRARFGL